MQIQVEVLFFLFSPFNYRCYNYDLGINHD